MAEFSLQRHMCAGASWVRAVVAAASLVIVGACQKTPAVVTIDFSGTSEESQQVRGAIEREIRNTLRVVDDEKRARWFIRIRTLSDGAPQSLPQFASSIRPSDAVEWRHLAQLRDDPSDACSTLSECAYRVAVRTRIWIDSLQASDDRLLAVAATPPDERRSVAILVLGERGHRSAIPQLVELVRSGSHSEAKAALGILATMQGVRPSISELIDAVLARGEHNTVELMFVIATIGGSEARAYLTTVADGHTDERVQRLARELLRSMPDATQREEGSP